MTPNYCTLEDIVGRIEPKARFFRQNMIPIGLCKTNKENWYAIAELLLYGENGEDWTALAICEIRLKDEDYRSVNCLLEEACENLDVPFENLIGQNVMAITRDTRGGEIIIVDSLGGL